MEAIAARAGVSKKTIYRWWPSKGAVVLEALTDLASAGAPQPVGGRIADDIHAQMTAVLAFLATPRIGSAYRGLIAETQHDRALAQQLVEQLIEPRAAQVLDRLRLAQEQNEIAPDADPQLILELLYGPVYYRMLLHLGPHPPEHIRRLIDHVITSFAPAPAPSADAS